MLSDLHNSHRFSITARNGYTGKMTKRRRAGSHRRIEILFVFHIIATKCSTIAATVVQPQVDLATLPSASGFLIRGAAAVDQSGFSVSAAGDINGDGIGDVIVGALIADPTPSGGGTARTDAGAAYVIFGRRGTGFGSFQLSSFNSAATSAGFRVMGVQAEDWCGYSVKGAGDVNKDGVDDIVIGARYADAPSKSDAGVTYVVFGRNVTKSGIPFTNIDLASFSSPTTLGYRIFGDVAGALTSAVSGAGDVNGDGYDDVIIGAPLADPVVGTARTDAGMAYVVFGKASIADVSLADLASSTTNGFRIIGASAGDACGTSVSGAGDINGDGIDDIVVGALTGDNTIDGVFITNVGITYVIFGRDVHNPFIQIDLAAFTLTAGFRLFGGAASDLNGCFVSGAGDVNGDGLSDLIVSSPKADVVGFGVPRIDAGVSYVVFGRDVAHGSPSFTDINFASFSSPTTVGFRILGAAANGWSGFSVSGAGDVNGDGVDDVIIGAAYERAQAGISYVVFGRNVGAGAPAFEDIDLLEFGTSAELGFRLLGVGAGDTSGCAVSGAGDVNGDGFADVIVGARYADPFGLSDSGASYVVFGASVQPTSQPSSSPTRQPSAQPSQQPRGRPSTQPSSQPTSQPSSRPTRQPSTQPSQQPRGHPSSAPSSQPTSQPSSRPTRQPSAQPSQQPRGHPSSAPSSQPSEKPSTRPSTKPSGQPSTQPSAKPTAQPTTQPSCQPSCQPSVQPSLQPSSQPTCIPTSCPSRQPSGQPSTQPTCTPSAQPTVQPSLRPTAQPVSLPTAYPTSQPSVLPSAWPSSQPSSQPTNQPTARPTSAPSSQPSSSPSAQPTSKPSIQPISVPSTQPSAQPSAHPSMQPIARPSTEPTSCPSTDPTSLPSTQPSSVPSAQPSEQPSGRPSYQPGAVPTAVPSSGPSTQPTSNPSGQPSSQPSIRPTELPSAVPSVMPSSQPSAQPTVPPSVLPTHQPSSRPSLQPTTAPSARPTLAPTGEWVAIGSSKAVFSQVFYAGGNVWACDNTLYGDSIDCFLATAETGVKNKQYHFGWSSVTGVLSRQNDLGIVISGAKVFALVKTSELATCAPRGEQLYCDVVSLHDSTVLVASFVPYPQKFVLVGLYNIYSSITIRDAKSGDMQSYLYTASNMKTLVLSQAQSPPHFVGSFIAGTTTRATAAPAHYIVAGMVRTEAGILSAMVLMPVTGDIGNAADLVCAMALEPTGPDSFVAGALQLEDNTGKHAYILRANALFMTIQYCFRYRSVYDGERRALAVGRPAQSVVRGMVLIEQMLYSVVDHEVNNVSSLSVLLVRASTGAIVKQVHISAPNSTSLRCTDIVYTDPLLVVVCTMYALAEQRSILLAVDGDLSFAVLPVGFMRSEQTIFREEYIPFKRSILAITKTSTTIPTIAYEFDTADQAPTLRPSLAPSCAPSLQATSSPSAQPISSPTSAPSLSARPTSQPSSASPTITHKPSAEPTDYPTKAPTVAPTARPSFRPAAQDSARPSVEPSVKPTAKPSVAPTASPTRRPSLRPTAVPTKTPTVPPTAPPSAAVTALSNGPATDSSNRSRRPPYIVGASVGGGLCLLLIGYLLYKYSTHKEEIKARELRKVAYFRRQTILAEQARAETAKYIQEENDRIAAIKLEKELRKADRRVARQRRGGRAGGAGGGAYAISPAQYMCAPASDSSASVHVSSLHSSEMSSLQDGSGFLPSEPSSGFDEYSGEFAAQESEEGSGELSSDELNSSEYSNIANDFMNSNASGEHTDDSDVSPSGL